MKQQTKEHDGDCDRERRSTPFPWEVQILTLISEQFAIPMDLLAALLGIDRPVAVRLMEKFASCRWVEIKQFYANDEPWVWLREAGAKHSATDFAPGAPKVLQLPHHRAVCEIRIALEREYPDGEWICERSLWRRRADQMHAPDAVFQVRNAEGEIKRWAIEVERTQKGKKFYGEIIAHRCAHYHRVLYYCTPRVARVLERIPQFRNSKVMVIESLKSDAETRNFQWKSPPGSQRPEPARNHIEPWEAKIIRLIAEQEAIPIDQLARFLGCDLASARRIADHLHRTGLVSQGLGPVNEGLWLWATMKGGRLAATTLQPVEPALLALPELRIINEARLFVQERDPDAQWWSRRMLRRIGRGAISPAGLVRSQDIEYAVEIEPRSRNRARLMKRYERRYAEHQGEGRMVLLLCSPANVELLKELQERCGWTNLLVEECGAFGTQSAKKSHLQSTLPLVRIDPKDLPPELLRKLAAREGASPVVKLAAKRKGSGFLRWLVTTEKNVWRITRTLQGWHLRPADEWEREQELLPAETSLSPKPKRIVPLVEIKIEDLPAELLQEIQKQEGTQSPPVVKLAAKRPGAGFDRWRVTTEKNVWRVSHTNNGWHVRPADEWEREQELLPPEPPGERRKQLHHSRKSPSGALVEVAIESLPDEALDALRLAAGQPTPPTIKTVRQRSGSGFPRWQIETDSGLWRVTETPQLGWHARPEDGSGDRPERRQLDPPGLMRDIDVSELPAKALDAIQRAASSPIPPLALSASKRRGKGALRWRVETDMDTWCVTFSPQGWYASLSE